jgi:hypothetical protein
MNLLPATAEKWGYLKPTPLSQYSLEEVQVFEALRPFWCHVLKRTRMLVRALWPSQSYAAPREKTIPERHVRVCFLPITSSRVKNASSNSGNGLLRLNGSPGSWLIVS